MPKVNEVIEKIEKFAPPETAANWDNSGWQINLGKDNFSKIMTALTVTENVVRQAKENGCDLIISHHPLIFEPLKSIEKGVITEAIENGIQIYSAHTNLDVAKGGTTDILAGKCGFTDTKPIFEFINGIHLEEELDAYIFAEEIKKRLRLDNIKIINLDEKKKIKSIAFCAGAGGSEIPLVNEAGYDLFITGEVKFHEAYEAKDTIVFEVGHYDSEKYVGEIFRSILGNIDTVEANEKRPYSYN